MLSTYHCKGTEGLAHRIVGRAENPGILRGPHSRIAGHPRLEVIPNRGGRIAFPLISGGAGKQPVAGFAYPFEKRLAGELVVRCEKR